MRPATKTAKRPAALWAQATEAWGRLALPTALPIGTRGRVEAAASRRRARPPPRRSRTRCGRCRH
eukprot:10553183-Lingulodinium_polyedra.AAC.1